MGKYCNHFLQRKWILIWRNPHIRRWFQYLWSNKKENMFAVASNGIIRFFIFVLSTSILITFCTSCHLELYNHPDFQKHSLSFKNSEGNLREEIRSIQVHGSCCWELQVLVGRPQRYQINVNKQLTYHKSKQIADLT